MPKYPVLRTWATILRVIGWFLLIVGALIFLIGLISKLNTSPGDVSAGILYIAGTLGMMGGMAVMSVGIGFIVYGEIIGVFLDIEENTRETRDATLALTRSLQSATGTAQTVALSAAPPPPPMPPKCGRCGAVNAIDSKFCESCGAPF